MQNRNHRSDLDRLNEGINAGGVAGIGGVLLLVLAAFILIASPYLGMAILGVTFVGLVGWIIVSLIVTLIS